MGPKVIGGVMGAPRPHFKPADTVAIDPGTKGLGWAHFRAGFLADCGFVTDGKRIPFFVGCYGVIELMHVSGGRTKNANALIAVQHEGSLAMGRMRPESVTAVTPMGWKGTVPKSVHHPRIWRALTPTERAVLEGVTDRITNEQAKDVLDAAGLGLWGLRRAA